MAFPHASRTLADARRGRFLHSARCARFGRNDNGTLPPFGRNDKKRPAFSPSIRASQATKITPPHCHFEHELGPPPCHFERRREAPESRNLLFRAPTATQAALHYGAKTSTASSVCRHKNSDPGRWIRGRWRVVREVRKSW